MTMVSSKAGLVTKTNPQTDDVESSKMDELEAASRSEWEKENWIGFENFYLLWLSLHLSVFHLILSQIMMPEVCDHCVVHPYGPVGALVLLVIYCMLDYFGFLFSSSLFLLLASFTKLRDKTEVTFGMQLGYSLTYEAASLTEDHFPRRGETTSYDFQLLILWIVLSAIIQVCTMSHLNKMLGLPNSLSKSSLLTIYKWMEQKKSEDSKDIPDQPYAV